MNVGFIGHGKVASSLAIYLQKHNNVNLSGFSVRNSGNLTEIINRSDIIFIAVPDDSIKDVDLRISQNISSIINIEEKIFCHTSGALSSTELKNLLHLESTCLSLHPPMTFACPEIAAEKLKQITCMVEGSGKNVNKFQLFLNTIDIKFSWISTDKKPLYHAAMCIASNYTVTMINAAQKLLKCVGIEDETANQTLSPLIYTTIENCLKNGAENSLTGPISRGDADTILLHMQNIPPEHKPLYTLTGGLTVDFAYSTGLISHDKCCEIKEILK